MPQIIQENKQVQALNEIKEELNIISSINVALSGSISYSVVGIGEDGQSLSKILVDERDQAKISSILSGQRSRLLKSVQGKSEKFRIALDKADLDILEGKSAVLRPRSRKKTKETSAISADKGMDASGNLDREGEPAVAEGEEEGAGDDDDISS